MSIETYDAAITLSPDFRVGRVDPRLFGSFLEHMGRAVHGGVFEPGHPEADDEGFRTDVLDLVRRLGTTAVRYPGGSFVSGYRWEDGVGPREHRPTRLDLAWHATETNAFGTDELMRWCRRADVEPMLAVNLGTRGVQEAVDLVEYCNHPGGTRLSDLRRAHGAEDPYDVRLWFLGNEMDGAWQIGHRPAADYGRLAAATGRAMRMVDPRIELVVCGSWAPASATFATWESAVLQECYDTVDHISLHSYHDPTGRTPAAYLATAHELDLAIDAVVATADHVGAALRSPKRLQVAVDEWNVWYRSRWIDPDPDRWPQAPPLLEDTYDDLDATMVASLLVTLLRHADRVSLACLAQLVNVIAPIRTDPGGSAWRQTTFEPFARIAAAARGEVLRVEPRVATYEAEAGEVPLLDATATYDEESGAVVLVLVNRSETSTARTRVALRGFPQATLDGARELEVAPLSWTVVDLGQRA
ncbi:alpha-N-arabinofuranosidase [Nocardioides lijunqiniae]|uniref:arabinosylfuranosidase ArfA n=1 Tax=Nocardioides lijunqiniae TaxID=2760832 RepID=UPI0018784FB3|nr:alpha-N-arabinofuranosidase [Nocardioides lijunqiniae]